MGKSWSKYNIEKDRLCKRITRRYWPKPKVRAAEETALGPKPNNKRGQDCKKIRARGSGSNKTKRRNVARFFRELYQKAARKLAGFGCEKKSLPPFGLPNRDGKCYRNAVIQVLAALPPLLHDVLVFRNKVYPSQAAAASDGNLQRYRDGTLPTSHPCQSPDAKRHLVAELADVLAAHWNRQRWPLNAALKRLDIAGKRAWDDWESRVKQWGTEPGPRYDSSTTRYLWLLLASLMFVDEDAGADVDPTTANFVIDVESVSKCASCPNETRQFYSWTGVEMNAPDACGGGRLDLEKVLETRLNTGPQAMHCPCCTNGVAASTRAQFTKLPRILALAQHRPYDPTTGALKGPQVEIPACLSVAGWVADNATVAPALPQPPGQRMPPPLRPTPKSLSYRLVGVIPLHPAREQDGPTHVTADVFNVKTDKWMRLDDIRVTKVDEHDVIHGDNTKWGIQFFYMRDDVVEAVKKGRFG